MPQAEGDARLASIPAGLPFLDILRDRLIAAHGSPDPMSLARVMVLLPTRRACLALRQSFLEAAGDRAIILPRIRPLGDLDDDDILWSEGVTVHDPAIDAAIAPAIGALERAVLLYGLVDRWQSRAREAGVEGLAATPAHGMALARDLGRFLDLVATEEADLARLSGHVPDALASHWQATASFLEILSVAWPAILAERGEIDPAERRSALLDALAAAWTDHPPEDPVVIAGSTGSIPATARLMKAVLGCPQGLVVLPGLDTDLDEASFALVEDTHPQAGLKTLLTALGRTRADADVWSDRDTEELRLRRRLINLSLRPTVTTHLWQSEIGRLFPAREMQAATDGLARVVTRDEHREAMVIALAMRETLETEGATAALVTPDRALARRVSATLARWGIDVNDSAGIALADTTLFRFLRLVIETVETGWRAVPLLALLKSPLTRLGLEDAARARAVGGLERKALRGAISGSGPGGLRRELTRREEDLARLERPFTGVEAVRDLIDRLERALAPLSDLAASGAALVLPDVVRAHLAAAEAIADADLWAGEEGEAGSLFLQRLIAETASLELRRIDLYPALFSTLLDGHVVRPRTALHPRLSIWGPLEARLQSADLVILGGLNEGSWPAEAEIDPWVNRPLRKAIGMSQPERRIGLAAHDFAQAASAPRVLMTRAEKVEGTPAVTSRWLMRLETVIGATRADNLLAPPRPYADWAARIDAPDRFAPVARPEPRPPAALRPTAFRVTDFATWQRDPYAIFARTILELRPLDPIDDIVFPRRFGTLVHETLQSLLEGDCLTNAARLLAEMRAAARTLALDPVEAIALDARLVGMTRSLAAYESERRANGIRTIGAEIGGELVLDLPSGSMTINGRADRIDRLADGSVAIIDYKTGYPPTLKVVKSLLEPQLPLLAILALGGAMKRELGEPVRVGALQYVSLRDGKKPQPKPLDDYEELIAKADENVRKLLAKYADDMTAYVPRRRMQKTTDRSDYDHLSRHLEWMRGEEAEEDKESEEDGE